MVDLSYSPQVQPESLPGRAYPRLPESVPSSAFGGEIGRGLETAGIIAQQHTDTVMQQTRQTQFAEGDNQVQALQKQLLTDPKNGAFTREGKNAFGLDQQYLPQFDAAAQKILASTPDPKAREALAKQIAQRRVEFSSQLDTHEIQQHKLYNAQVAKDSVDIATDSAAGNYNHPDIIASNLQKIDGALANLSDQQGWSPEQFAEARYEARTKLHEGVIDGMLADGKVDLARSYYDTFKGELKPQEAKAFQTAIQAGEVKTTANNILSAYRVDTHAGARALSSIEHSGLTPEQQSAVIQQVETGRRELAIARQQDPAVHRELMGVTDSIALGRADAGTLSQIESLYRRGAITDEQHLTYRDAADRALKKQDGEQAELDRLRDAFTNSTPLDPKDEKDKKGADLLLKAATLNAPPGSAAYNNAALTITSRVGVVPESAISFGRASLVGGDPQTAAAGAQLMACLSRANPRAYQMATDQETRTLADTINRAVSAGADPEAAVNMARENAQKSPAERAGLEQRWKARYPSSKDAGRLESSDLAKILSHDPLYEGERRLLFFHQGVPDVPPALQAEFDGLTHDYFIHTGGNLQQAEQLAVNDLKGTWGVSEVNGQRELMKYAPERMFPGLTPNMVRDDLKASGHGDANLVESNETSTSGGRVWNLSTKDQFGAYDVVRDKSGRPLRYQLPEVTAAQRQAADKQRQDDLAKLAAERQRQDAFTQFQAQEGEAH